MEAADSELPKLKSLAAEVMAAEAPEPLVLEELAALAAALAARCREAARQRLIEEVATAAQTIFPGGSEEVRSRLGQSPADELAGLAALLDQAKAAGSAFVRADAGLMAAHDRGDYAAMAPLALEADTQKNTLSAVAAEFAGRIGLGGRLTADLKPAAAAPPGHTDADAAEAAVADPPSNVLELDLRAEAQPERRRLRALIRQMRPATDEAS